MTSLSPVHRVASEDSLLDNGVSDADFDECFEEEEEDPTPRTDPRTNMLREGEADEDVRASSHDAELAALRGEKCFLEFRTAELEEQVTEMKQSALRSDDDTSIVHRLETEILAYKQGVEAARVALEEMVEEKRVAEEKLRSIEAVFNERKRNFDHIITIFGEEKKTILEAKCEVEEKLRIANEELNNVHSAPPPPPAVDAEEMEKIEKYEDVLCELKEKAAENDSLNARVEELETMLGSSGLARQTLQQKNEALEEELASCKQTYQDRERSSTEVLLTKSEELKAKIKEISDLKHYVGKKSIQWEQFKEDAITAKRKLEEKLDDRCTEMAVLQDNLTERQEAIDTMRAELDTKHKQLDQLKTSNTTTSADLMGLLEEKEQIIEELVKKADSQPGPVNTASIANLELTQLATRNKNLEDEVMGLKSLIFKLERRSTRSSATGGSAATAHRTPSPTAFTRSLSGQRGGRFPSPAARGYQCPSPTARTGRKASMSSSNRGVSPMGRASPVPRAYSPCTTARRASVGGAGQPTMRANAAAQRLGRQSGNSPLRKVPASMSYGTPTSSLYASPNTRVAVNGNGAPRKSVGGTATPLAPRSVNCQAGEV